MCTYLFSINDPCNQIVAKNVKYDIHLYHSYLSVFFVSAGFPNGEFPEILIAKCRSRFYCTWFFSRAEDFESWREWRMGSSKSGEKCSRGRFTWIIMYYFILNTIWWKIFIFVCPALGSKPRSTTSNHYNLDTVSHNVRMV
jgi:hypothetical protein